MSVSIRALKRKNKYRNKERKQDKILTKANSLNSLNFQENIQAQPNLQVCKSESDVAKICSVPTATAMNFAKSERFLESIIQVNNNMQYVNQETSSIPNREAFRSSSTLRRPSIDPECSRQELQSKINIFGYEVMENRERFTVINLY